MGETGAMQHQQSHHHHHHHDAVAAAVSAVSLETDTSMTSRIPYDSLYSSSSYLSSMRPDYLYLNHVLSDTGSQRRSALPPPPVGVTSLAFDHEEELLWMGNEWGHVTSYYGLNMEKYTSFQVHAQNDIRAQVTGEYGLLSLTKNSLRMSLRRGLTVFDHTSDYLKDMYCMALTENRHVILMAGQQSEVLEFDLEKVKAIRVTEIGSTDDESGCMIIRDHPKFACCGDAFGKITLRDKKTLRNVHTFSTHSGQLSDFDVRGNYLITCGGSQRNGNYNIDRFLMVFDLRMMKAIQPIGMTLLPYFLRFVPVYASKFCVVTQTGQFQLMDTTGITTPPSFLHNMDLPPEATVSAFDVSSTSQALAFADTAGYVYLFGASTEILFNQSSQLTEFPDEVQRFPPISVDDYMTPFSLIPPHVVPPIDEKDRDDFYACLSSNLPADACKKIYRRPKPIDPEILSTMRMTGSVGYAPNPRGRRTGWESIYESGDDYVETTLASYFASMSNGDECQTDKVDTGITEFQSTDASEPSATMTKSSSSGGAELLNLESKATIDEHLNAPASSK